jgi:hypothetical protein
MLVSILLFLGFCFSYADKEVYPKELSFINVPIDIHWSNKDSHVLIDMCSLNYSRHSENPALTPFFSDLTESCSSVYSIYFEEIETVYNSSRAQIASPTGFVFHSARCGSTLVANILAAESNNLVYSEPKIPLKIFALCRRYGCSDERRAHMIRTIVAAMWSGPSKRHSAMFIKYT